MENLLSIQIGKLFEFEDALECTYQKGAGYCQKRHPAPLRLGVYLPGENLTGPSCSVHFIEIQ